jgi:hypothetical protein
MSDIRLISIIPTPGVQQSGSISQGSSGAAGVFVNFSPGSILSGFIVNRDASGNPVLRTDTGDLTFQSKLFLKIGSEITIRVENRAGNLLAHILTVNGQLPETLAAEQHVSNESAAVVLPKFSELEQKAAAPTQVSVPAQNPAQPQSAQLQAATQPPIALSQPSAPKQPLVQPQTFTPTQVAQPDVIRNTPTIVVSGVLLTTPNVEPDAPEPPPLAFRIVNLQTPENPVQQTAYAAYARTTGTPTPLVAPPVSTPVPTATPTAPQPLILGQIFTAPVIAIEPTGEPLIQTPAGIVRLQGTQLPQAAQVTLEVLPPQIPMAPALPLPPAPLPELAKQWTSLQQITTLLATHTDAPSPPWFAPLAPSANTPTGSQEISSGLMVFVTALRGGNFSNWLGDDTVEWLQKNGHVPLVKKAEAEFTTLVRAFTEPTAQTNQWQSLFFPVAVDGQWQQVRMFLKRDRKQNKKMQGNHEDDTRFIVEMSLTQLGELQLDGLVRRTAKQVEFDLFIRSLSPLEAAIQHDIQRIYSDMAAITGYRGQLAFQAVREFPVNPMKEAMAASGGVVA